jgi:hypothetical protein
MAKYCPICLQIPSKVKAGKIIPVALKYLIFATQNSPCGTPQAHGSDLAPMKYPTEVTDSSRKYFSRLALGTAKAEVVQNDV